MASTMPVWTSANPRVAALAALLCLAVAGNSPPAAGFSVAALEQRFDNGLLVVDGRIDYSLTATATEALENGVDLVISQRLSLERPRWWWRDVEVVSQQRRYRLAYHAMSRRYVLNRLASGESRSYRSLDALLTRLGTIEAWPVIGRDRLDDQQTYRLRFETELDVEALPRLLRTVAWASDDWQLRSEPATLEVRP